RLVPPVGHHRFKLAKPREAALNRREVGEQPPEPALVDEEHAATLRFFGDGVLGLPLRADEEQRAALRRGVGDEIRRLFVKLGCSPEVENVDAVALAEDVRLHLGVPALRLVSKMDAGFQKILHSDRTQAGLDSFLTFTELEAFARSGHSVLLALLGARVAREEAGFSKPRSELGIVIDERAGDAET